MLWAWAELQLFARLKSLMNVMRCKVSQPGQLPACLRDTCSCRCLQVPACSIEQSFTYNIEVMWQNTNSMNASLSTI